MLIKLSGWENKYRMNYIYGLLMSWGMFTIIPCPYKGWKEEARGNMLVCFPVVGLFIGFIWYAVFKLTGFIPNSLRAVIIAIVPWLLTGFIHLDGYTDVCDAVMSRRDLETRQKILKDSRVGAFAVICICILMLAQTGSSFSLLEVNDKHSLLALIFIPVASRLSASFAVINMKPMKTSQYSELIKRTQYNVILIIMMLIVIVLVFGVSVRAGISVISVIIVYWICALYGYKMLDGMNGDISGYALTISELAGIIGLIL